jgi:hypothetical protein
MRLENKQKDQKEFQGNQGLRLPKSGIFLLKEIEPPLKKPIPKIKPCDKSKGPIPKEQPHQWKYNFSCPTLKTIFYHFLFFNAVTRSTVSEYLGSILSTLA